MPEGEYKVEIYQDGLNADRFATDYVRYETMLPADGILRATMVPAGGWVARIIPVRTI